jgi:predicted metal-dependent peptidase
LALKPFAIQTVASLKLSLATLSAEAALLPPEAIASLKSEVLKIRVLRGGRVVYLSASLFELSK